MLVDFNVKRLTDTATLPTKANESDAGIDIYADEDIIIRPMETVLVSTGISVEFPSGYVALLWDRSGMAVKRQVHRMAGVIDCSYRGEWKVCLVNLSGATSFIGTGTAAGEDVEIKKGDRIVQCVFQKVEPVKINEVTELSDTVRGEGGFGSTGA
jgi:dUTP pyrophosphatase